MPALSHPLPIAALRILFDATQEVMGQKGLEAILIQANLPHYLERYPSKSMTHMADFTEYAAAEQAIEDFYGPRGARAILLRIGKATFQYGLRDESAVLGLSGLVLRALPKQTRMRFVLEKMAKASTEKLNKPSHVREEEDAFYFVTDICACRWRPKHDAPCCFVVAGALMEAMAWATGDIHQVDQVACISMGATSCVYRVIK